MLYVLLRRLTWRNHKAAFAVSQHLNLSLGWYVMSDPVAGGFTRGCERLFRTWFGADADLHGDSLGDAQLRQFSLALSTALDKDLEPLSLFGLEGLPTFCTNFIFDMTTLSSDRVAEHMRQAHGQLQCTASSRSVALAVLDALVAPVRAHAPADD